MDTNRTPKPHQIDLSPHSVERFRERARPTLGLRAASRELGRMVEHIAEVCDSAPEWLTRTMAQSSPFYAVIGGDLVLPLREAGNGRWVATTCLGRGCISEPARERRNQVRQARAARRRFQREGGRRSEGRRVIR